MTDYENLYATYLAEARRHPEATTHDVEHYMRGPTAYAMVGNEFREMPFDEFLEINARVVKDEISPYMKRAKTVVEIVCGYGHNLAILRKSSKKSFVGLERSASGVELARYLFRDDPLTSFCEFDMNMSYDLLRSLKPPILVFTKHAIEQLPTAKPFIEGMQACRDIVSAVINLEPLHGPEVSADKHFADARRRYAQENGLNTDLLAMITATKNVKHVHPLLIGFSPNSMTSAVMWRP